ncbi:helix-turn-helix domain-containing protein [Aurantimonas marina]|uniref:helix-turn-helix domain-containing protein n=1 Tax=Aurantimonas marina TaxID=2780508 RepID=UPI0019D074C6|nr:helix-turn-helix domain-containing protein [Aurantimonas marina]
MQSISPDRVSARPGHWAPVACGEADPVEAEAGPIIETDRQAVARTCRLAREIAGAFFAIPVREIEQPGRAIASVCEARHVAMYLVHVVFQIPLSAMAEGFGRDRTTIAYAVRRIEDRRDDQAFDAAVERLEGLAHAVRAALNACEHGCVRGVT